jgi:hypothetical protein
MSERTCELARRQRREMEAGENQVNKLKAAHGCDYGCNWGSACDQGRSGPEIAPVNYTRDVQVSSCLLWPPCARLCFSLCNQGPVVQASQRSRTTPRILAFLFPSILWNGVASGDTCVPSLSTGFKASSHRGCGRLALLLLA